MTQPEVGTGRISFDDLEALIMTNVHQNWDRKGVGVHAIEPTPNQNDLTNNGGEFEIAGELYRLEFKDGKKVPVKVNRPKKGFKGKCWKCDREGHFGRDCFVEGQWGQTESTKT